MSLLIVLCAKYFIWVVVLGGVVYATLSHDKARLAAFAAASLALAYGLGKLAGYLWYDPRPFVSEGVVPLFAHAANNGFPSDHMLLGATIASIVYVRHRALGVALWVLALAVGAARVLSGVHHAADLAGSIVIAIVAVAIVEYALRRLWPQPQQF